MGDPEAHQETDEGTEETEFLLASVEDLDREYAAGDLSEADHTRLRDAYVARAAALLEPSAQTGAAVASGAERSPSRSRSRGWVWILGTVVFATLAGVTVARAAGSRAPGETITGNATSGGMGSRVQRCQQLFGRWDEALACFDKLLAEAPDQVDALAYKGWALVRSGDPEAGMKLFERVDRLAPEYPGVYAFRASVKADRGDFVGAKAELDALAKLGAPAEVTQVISQMGLDRKVAEGLLPPATRACWELFNTLAAQQSTASTTVPSGATTTSPVSPTDIAECADRAAVTEPRAVLLKALLYMLIPGDVLTAEAAGILDGYLASAPDDPDARLLRVTLDLDRARRATDLGVSQAERTRLLSEAGADLDSLDGLASPSPLFEIYPADELRTAYRQLGGGAS